MSVVPSKLPTGSQFIFNEGPSRMKGAEVGVIPLNWPEYGAWL